MNEFAFLALLQGGMSGCRTDWGVFLKTLIISSSKIIETSSELFQTSSELISTGSELISTSSELIRTITEQCLFLDLARQFFSFITVISRQFFIYCTDIVVNFVF